MKQALGMMLAAVLLLGAVNAAEADVIVFRQAAGTETFGGTDYAVTSTVFDDKWMANSNQGDYGLTFFMDTGWDGVTPLFDQKQMMVAVSELFSLLPATQGGQTIQINSATLRLKTYASPNEGNELTAYRIKTDWLLGQAPGAAQTNSKRMYRDIANETPWVTGPDGYFGVDDVDTACASPAVAWTTGDHDFDVSDIVARMYELGENYGFTVLHTGGTVPNTGFIRAYQSTNNKDNDQPWANGPSLYIDYEYVPEPATLGLLAVGGLGVLIRRRRHG